MVAWMRKAGQQTDLVMVVVVVMVMVVVEVVVVVAYVDERKTR